MRRIGSLIKGSTDPLWRIPLQRTVLMKHVSRLAVMVGFTIILVSSLAQATSFLIELNNGREITTPHLWEEGEEIKFHVAQGTAGVPKALVKRIKTVTLASNERGSKSAVALNRPDPARSAADKRLETHANKHDEIQREADSGKASHSPKHANERRLPEGASHAYRQKKLELTSKLDHATTQYLDAIAARNHDAKHAALDDMRGYSKRIIELGDEVKMKNDGELPHWWNE